MNQIELVAGQLFDTRTDQPFGKIIDGKLSKDPIIEHWVDYRTVLTPLYDRVIINNVWDRIKKSRVKSSAIDQADEVKDNPPITSWSRKFLGLANSPWSRAAAAGTALISSGAFLEVIAHATSGYEQSIHTNIQEKPNLSTTIIDWSPGAPMPCPEANFGYTVASNGHVIVMGGEGRTGPPCDTSGLYISTNYEFNPGTGIWSVNPNMSIPRRQLALAADGTGNVYATGGQDDAAFTEGLDIVEIYNVFSQTMTLGVSMPVRRIGHRAEFVNNELYVFGGTNGTGILKSVSIFSPTTQLWRPGPDMINARLWFASVVKDGKILAISGNGGFGEIPNVESLDPKTGIWTALPNITTPRFFLSAGVLSGLGAVTIGGAGNHTYYDTAEVFSGTWSINTSLPIAISNNGTVSDSANAQIFEFGGIDQNARYVSNTYFGRLATPTPNPTNTETRTPTASVTTSTATPTAFLTFTPSPLPTKTRTATASATTTPTATPTNFVTYTPSPQPTETKTATASVTAISSVTPVPVVTRIQGIYIPNILQ